MNNTQPSSDLFEQRAFTIFPRQAGVFYTMNTNPGGINTIRAAVDPTISTQSGAKDYLFSRMAVAPMDIRIEALIYAQNESFFVIPGYALNQNPADTRDAALRRATDAGLPAGSMLRPSGTTDMYPFYNEPYDCRITIVGAVAECRTASAADQAAWLQLWGYIPEAFGSTGKNPPDPNAEIRIPQEHTLGNEMGGAVIPDSRTTAERNFYGQNSGFARGLRFIYDPALTAPFVNYTPGARAYRTDNYGRVLPPLPRLPVSPGFAIAADDRP
jgi:hypothetical protein